MSEQLLSIALFHKQTAGKQNHIKSRQVANSNALQYNAIQQHKSPEKLQGGCMRLHES